MQGPRSSSSWGSFLRGQTVRWAPNSVEVGVGSSVVQELCIFRIRGLKLLISIRDPGFADDRWQAVIATPQMNIRNAEGAG